MIPFLFIFAIFVLLVGGMWHERGK